MEGPCIQITDGPLEHINVGFNTTTAKMSPGMTLFSVQAILILGTEDGARIFAKYFSSPHSAPHGKPPP